MEGPSFGRGTTFFAGMLGFLSGALLIAAFKHVLNFGNWGSSNGYIGALIGGVVSFVLMLVLFVWGEGD